MSRKETGNLGKFFVVIINNYRDHLILKKDLLKVQNGTLKSVRNDFINSVLIQSMSFIGYNPQFCLEIDNKSEQSSAVSLLLSRHITVTEEEVEDFITLHVYNDTNGQKIYYP